MHLLNSPARRIYGLMYYFPGQQVVRPSVQLQSLQAKQTGIECFLPVQRQNKQGRKHRNDEDLGDKGELRTQIVSMQPYLMEALGRQ